MKKKLSNLLHQLSPQRLMIYLFLLSLLPLLLLVTHLHREYSHLRTVHTTLCTIGKRGERLQREGRVDRLIEGQLVAADPHYLERALEHYLPRERERKDLELIAGEDPTYALLFASRLEALERAQASPHFSEEAIMEIGKIRECTERLLHPIQVDLQDCETLLQRIEGEAEGKPQLLIKEWNMKRKMEGKNETYLLHLSLLKREMIPCVR